MISIQYSKQPLHPGMKLKKSLMLYWKINDLKYVGLLISQSFRNIGSTTFYKNIWEWKRHLHNGCRVLTGIVKASSAQKKSWPLCFVLWLSQIAWKKNPQKNQGRILLTHHYCRYCGKIKRTHFVKIKSNFSPRQFACSKVFNFYY